MQSKKRILIIALATILICTILISIFTPSYSSYPGWIEGKVMAGSIGMMLYEYAETKGRDGIYPPSWEDLMELYPDWVDVDDFFGKAQFKKNNFNWEASYDNKLDPPIKFKITVTAPKGFKGGPS